MIDRHHMNCDSSAGHVQQAEPNNGRMEVDLEAVSLQMDTFKPQGSPYVWRLAFSIHQLEASPLPPLHVNICLFQGFSCLF